VTKSFKTFPTLRVLIRLSIGMDRWIPQSKAHAGARDLGMCAQSPGHRMFRTEDDWKNSKNTFFRDIILMIKRLNSPLASYPFTKLYMKAKPVAHYQLNIFLFGWILIFNFFIFQNLVFCGHSRYKTETKTISDMTKPRGQKMPIVNAKLIDNSHLYHKTHWVWAINVSAWKNQCAGVVGITFFCKMNVKFVLEAI